MTDELHIGDRIADLAAAHPEQVAIIVVGPRGEETAMTWSELDQRANAAARGLKQEGVRDDTVVGVALPPGFEHAVAVVGSWKLGATVVPLNPRNASDAVWVRWGGQLPKGVRYERTESIGVFGGSFDQGQ